MPNKDLAKFSPILLYFGEYFLCCSEALEFDAILFCSYNKKKLIKLKLILWELENTDYASRRPEFNSQHPHDGSQQSVNAIPRESDALSQLPQALHANAVQTRRQNIHTHSIVKYLKV